MLTITRGRGTRGRGVAVSMSHAPSVTEEDENNYSVAKTIVTNQIVVDF